MGRVELQIDGMSCGHCVARVTKTLATLPGVSVEKVEIGSAIVEASDPSAAETAVVAALHEAGYEARPRPSASVS